MASSVSKPDTSSVSYVSKLDPYVILNIFKYVDCNTLTDVLSIVEFKHMYSFITKYDVSKAVNSNVLKDLVKMCNLEELSGFNLAHYDKNLLQDFFDSDVAGKIQSLECNGLDISNVPSPVCSPYIYSDTPEYNSPYDLKTFQQLHTLKITGNFWGVDSLINLRYLEIDKFDCHMDFNKLKNLETLIIYEFCNPIKLGGLINLKKLTMSYMCSVCDLSLIPNLEELRVGYGGQLFYMTQQYPSIKKLTIDRNIGKNSQISNYFPHLRELHLYTSTDPEICSIKELHELTNLYIISCSPVLILPESTSVRYLNIVGMNTIVTDFHKIPNLETVILEKTVVNIHSIEKLHNLSQ